jgi:hypothetical protein
VVTISFRVGHDNDTQDDNNSNNHYVSTTYSGTSYLLFSSFKCDKKKIETIIELLKITQAMHGCCNSPPSALLTFDTSFKQYPKTSMKFINEYQMNIQQDRKKNNAVNYQNPRKPQVMKKGAVRFNLK